MKFKFLSKKLYQCLLTDDYCKFDSARSADDWGKKHYGEWTKNYKRFFKDLRETTTLSSYASKPIEMFCGYGYYCLNSFLRENSFFDGETSGELKVFSNVLQIAICSAPRIPENIIVYKLVTDDVIENFFNGSKAYIYQEKGFLSTSLNINFFNNNDEHYSKNKNMLKIYVKKGTIGAFVSHIDYRDESEILFLPNSELVLIKKPYRYKDKNIFECLLLP